MEESIEHKRYQDIWKHWDMTNAEGEAGLPEEAVRTFEEGFNCAQSILATFGPDLGLDRIQALRVASGFGGGMGRMAQTCGVVTGAFMVLGLKFGHTTTDDAEAKNRTEELCREFVGRFTERNGSIVCRDLLGCDISTDEGREEARERGLSEKQCRGFGGDP